ncbi:hypothetical protein JYG23_12560 [Sedimentibacter sp. zth1]|uniref:YczE/YyaS/YitT family protein n=1 Tax=Sedimentibacter sp. zth1 TaxID=2816908 RepID=UPI001A910E9F|nr:hypothetical protein [Sedimentibacter sp. zth1]QSX05496.1 hypothetical protein JYG23_12560 [Sedimentibacter sp. zth1]
MHKHNLTFRYIKLMIGLFICSIGINLFLYCNLGMNPWNVFNQGLSIHLPITLGQASQIVGILIITICIFFKIYPGFATILNMFFIGFFIDIISNLNIISVPQTLVGKIAMCLGGLLVLSLGMFVYITQELGAGPRDGLILAITQRTRFNIGIVKNAIEITVVIVGVLLGGKFGIGTIIASLLGGPVLQTIFKIFKVNPKELKQETIIDVCNKLKAKA